LTALPSSFPARSSSQPTSWPSRSRAATRTAAPPETSASLTASTGAFRTTTQVRTRSPL